MKQWMKRLGLVSCGAAMIVGAALLQGNTSGAITKSIRLDVYAPPVESMVDQAIANREKYQKHLGINTMAITREEIASQVSRQLANREKIFGTSDVRGGVLDIKMTFERKDSELGYVTGTGYLHVGGKKYPVQFEDHVMLEKTQDGRDFYLGGVRGTVTVESKNIPTSVFIAAIPDTEKYVFGMTLQPEEGTAVALRFGEHFPEYTEFVNALLKANRGGN